MKSECPHCGQHYEVEKSDLNQIAQCISCHQEFYVEVIPEAPSAYQKQTPELAPIVEESVFQAQAPVMEPVGSQQTFGVKVLSCEMCGSSELIKKDGVFVCQACGIKYSVEEAKKMMIAGTVNVAGTVTVDNSSFVKKYLENARRALDKTDWEEVEKYYNMVEQNEPHNIEAIFYSSYGKAMLSLTDVDHFKRKQKFDVFCKSESVIDDYYDASKSEYLKPIIEGMSQHLLEMTKTNFVCHPKDTTPLNRSGYPNYISFPTFFHSGDKPYTEAMFAMSEVQFIESIENIIAKDEKAYLYKIVIDHYDWCLSSDILTTEIKTRIRERRKTATERLKQLDPSAKVTLPTTLIDGSCYVATAVYGSYNCPEVWTLRRFRDYALATKWYGRLFISLYYATSPFVVKHLGHNEFMQKCAKKHIDTLVQKLRAAGFKSTPYKDKARKKSRERRWNQP